MLGEMANNTQALMAEKQGQGEGTYRNKGAARRGGGTELHEADRDDPVQASKEGRSVLQVEIKAKLT